MSLHFFSCFLEAAGLVEVSHRTLGLGAWVERTWQRRLFSVIFFLGPAWIERERQEGSCKSSTTTKVLLELVRSKVLQTLTFLLLLMSFDVFCMCSKRSLRTSSNSGHLSWLACDSSKSSRTSPSTCTLSLCLSVRRPLATWEIAINMRGTLHT